MRRREAERIRRAIRTAREYVKSELLSLKEIDKRMGKTRGTASRDLRLARQLGLLTVRRDRPLPLNEEIGSQLGKRFDPAKILVIDTSDPILAARKRRRGSGEEDDELHEILARNAAQYLSGTLKHRDLVGVGAGRAAFHTARALQHMPGDHEKTRGVIVFGLHGHVTRRVWRETSRYALQSIDAVRVTHTMINALPRAAARALHVPLVQRDADSVRQAFEGDAWFLTRREWNRRPPAIAVVGLGVMGGPSILDPSARGTKTVGPKPEETRPIRPQLRTLREICRRFFDKHDYVPISDVCDRVFWVPEDDETPNLRLRALPLMREVNEHLLTVETGLPPTPRELPPDQRRCRPGSLDQVQEVLMVAGGKHKVRALYRLLRHRREDEGRRFIDTLVTDVRTAEDLLQLEEASEL